MKKAIDEHIPFAVEAIKQHLAKGERLEVKKGYNGAIAEFGTGLHHNGVLATVAIFMEDGGEVDKKDLLKTIHDVLRKKRSDLKGGNLFECLLNHESELPVLKKDLTNIAIAVKLAIRTFKLV